MNVNANWYSKSIEKSTVNNLENDVVIDGDVNANCAAVEFPTDVCMPVPLNTLPVTLSTKIKVCQVCNYEMRPLSGGQSRYVVGMVFNFVPRLSSFDNVAYLL